AAQKAWKQTSKSRPGPGILVAAVEKQKASEQWQRDGGQFIPHPSTWLRQGRWLDEATNIPDPSAPSFEGDAPRDQYGQRIKIVT
ncbi:MAG TPA: hypothetical protein VIT91_08135, partial [Chthoniobacterales bacterium]